MFHRFLRMSIPVLTVGLLAGAATAIQVPTPDFLSWSKSKCRNVIGRSSETGGESQSKSMLKGFMGVGSSALAMWVSEDAAKAIARITKVKTA